MKSISISGFPRENVGKRDAKELRKQSKVPCVLYGGKEHVHFSVDEKSLKPLIYTSNVHIVKITVEGKEYEAKIQELQTHKVTEEILHIDFLQLLPEKYVTFKIPIKVEGNSEGIKKGGKLITKVKRLKISSLPENLPDYIIINIDKLDIGDSVRVKDLASDKYTFLDLPNALICGIRVTRNTVVEATPGAPAAAAPVAAAPAAK